MPLGQVKSANGARARLKPEQANAFNDSICNAHSGLFWKGLGPQQLCLRGMDFGKTPVPIVAPILGGDLQCPVHAENLGEDEKIWAPPSNSVYF